MKQKKVLFKSIAIAWCFLSLGSLVAQNVTTPRPVSPAAEVKQTIGLTEITVNYSRPRVIDQRGNDRTDKIWGALVPYGFTDLGFGNRKPAPWRAGANENTTIAFSDDVKIEGKELKAGTYGLHIAVKENNDATVIFSTNTASWGSYFYEEAEDALRVDIKTEEVQFTQTLTFGFADYTANSTVLVLDWEKKRFPINIEVDVHNQVVANFKNELRSVAGFGWQGPLGAAQYCLNNNTHLEEALAWADQSIGLQSNFNNMSTKSQLLVKLDKQGEADKVMQDALALSTATAGDYYGYGRALIGLDKDKEALAIFEKLNKKWPDHWLAPHGLARGYSALGNYKKALPLEKKALEKAPDGSKPFLEGYVKTLESGEDFN